MAFFSKLKDRLFKSSSKLEQGLDAIVEDGGEAETVSPNATPDPDPTIPAPDPAPEPVPELPDPAPAPQPPEPAQPMPADPPVPPAPPEMPEAQAQPSKGLLGRLFARSEPKTVLRRTLDDDMLEQLEELLIASDMGVDTALRVTSNMAEGRLGRKLSTEEIKQLLAQEVARVMEPVAKPMPIYPKRPQVVLVVGVNGSGKTTTIGKLASQFKAAGKKVVIAAGDTFRAAAVEQLQVWGERAGVPVLTAPEGSDPASLAFDALTRAQAGRRRPADDRHRRPPAEPRRPDGGAGQNRPRDPQEGRDRAAQHTAGAGCHHRPERAEPGGNLPQTGRRVGPW